MNDRDFSFLRLLVIVLVSAMTFVAACKLLADTIQTWIKEAHKPQQMTLIIQTSGFKATDMLTKKETL